MKTRPGALVVLAIGAVVAGVGLLGEGRAAKQHGSVIGKVTVRSGKRVLTDLSRVVVYVEGESLPARVPRDPPRMVQRNMAFDPAFLVVSRGTTVSFPNEERKEHNVYSLSLGNTFDLGVYKKSKGKSQTFDSAGEVNIGCRKHASMSAKIYVVPNGSFDDDVKDGTFRIDQLPPGTYTLTAWMPAAAAPFSAKITIEAGKTTRAPSLELEQSPEPADRRRKEDPRGRSYD